MMCSDLARDRESRPKGPAAIVIAALLAFAPTHVDAVVIKQQMQFCDAEDHSTKGLHKGQLFTWNVYGDVAAQGGVLVETATVPETQYTITQGTGTVTEYGQAVPYTQKLDNLSLHPVTKIVHKVLKNDCKKALDDAAYDQFNLTKLHFVATTATDTGTLYTNGSATGTNSIALNTAHVKLIIDTMKERNIPPYMGDDYFAVFHPTTLRPFKNQLESIHQYTETGLAKIFNGEIGRYEGTRFIEQTAIPKDAWTNGKSNQGHFFGEDTVHEAIVIPEEIRADLPHDFGRKRGIMWYYLGGFAIVHTVAAQSRIVKWASQA